MKPLNVNYHAMENLLKYKEELEFKMGVKSIILTTTYSKQYQTIHQILMNCLMTIY